MVFLVIVTPMALSWVVLGATGGAGPMHAERHDRRREHRSALVQSERAAACLFGLAAAAVIGGSLVYLWMTKTP